MKNIEKIKELEKLKKEYLKLSCKKEVPKTYDAERLKDCIQSFRKIKRENNKRIKFFIKNLGIDYKPYEISGSSMNRYFTKSQVDKFDFNYSNTKNDYKNYTKLYDLYLVVEKTIKEKIKVRDNIKKYSDCDKEYEEKFNYIDDVFNRIKISQFKNTLEDDLKNVEVAKSLKINKF